MALRQCSPNHSWLAGLSHTQVFLVSPSFCRNHKSEVGVRILNFDKAISYSACWVRWPAGLGTWLLINGTSCSSGQSRARAPADGHSLHSIPSNWVVLMLFSTAMGTRIFNKLAVGSLVNRFFWRKADTFIPCYWWIRQVYSGGPVPWFSAALLVFKTALWASSCTHTQRLSFWECKVMQA